LYNTQNAQETFTPPSHPLPDVPNCGNINNIDTSDSYTSTEHAGLEFANFEQNESKNESKTEKIIEDDEYNFNSSEPLIIDTPEQNIVNISPRVNNDVPIGFDGFGNEHLFNTNETIQDEEVSIEEEVIY